jgi:hypothetical protein
VVSGLLACDDEDLSWWYVRNWGCGGAGSVDLMIRGVWRRCRAESYEDRYSRARVTSVVVWWYGRTWPIEHVHGCREEDCCVIGGRMFDISRSLQGCLTSLSTASMWHTHAMSSIWHQQHDGRVASCHEHNLIHIWMKRSTDTW